MEETRREFFVRKLLYRKNSKQTENRIRDYMISDNTGGVSRGETTEVQHHSYKKWCDFLGSDTALTKGFVEHGLKEETSAAASRQEGVWKTAPCMANCSCKSSRCLLKAYVVDGIPTKLTTDEQGEDSIENLQHKACARGYAQISNYLSADRVKYPMKRKGWSPENPHGELRGRDEWERISWDEALDIIASEMRKVIDEYGTRGILTIGYPHFEPTTFDHFDCLLNALGGALHPAHATISLGSWPFVELFMTGGLFEAPDYLSIQESDLHFFFGCNWEAVKSGNTAHQLSAAKEAGGKIIIIDPWLNQTAQSMADEWIPIRPGTDTAFVLGIRKPGYGTPLASPWFSYYAESTPQVFGKKTLEVRAAYSRHGLSFERKNHEPDDHLGIMLQFVATLISREAKAFSEDDISRASTYRKERKAFLQENVIPWVSHWKNLVLEDSVSPFYQGLALLVTGSLQSLDKLAVKRIDHRDN